MCKGFLFWMWLMVLLLLNCCLYGKYCYYLFCRAKNLGNLHYKKDVANANNKITKFDSLGFQAKLPAPYLPNTENTYAHKNYISVFLT
jgi:hypothetical protein